MAEVQKSRFLLCFDGSKHATKALEYVVKNARSGSAVILFGAYAKLEHQEGVAPQVPGAVYIRSPGDIWASEERQRRRNEVSYRLMQAKKVLLDSGKFQDLDVTEVLLETADIRDAVLATAEREHADAIVCGSRGYGTLKRVVLGSLSSYLVHNAPLPVIVCRAPDDAPTTSSAAASASTAVAAH